MSMSTAPQTTATPTADNASEFVTALHQLAQYWTQGLISEEELQAAEMKLLRGELAWDLVPQPAS